jgi:hypothetical protein
MNNKIWNFIVKIINKNFLYETLIENNKKSVDDSN